jgi:acyl-CoA thioesterase-2
VVSAAAARRAPAGRGLTRGMIFKQDGTLVASVAQEGSLRERK